MSPCTNLIWSTSAKEGHATLRSKVCPQPVSTSTFIFFPLSLTGMMRWEKLSVFAVTTCGPPKVLSHVHSMCRHFCWKYPSCIHVKYFGAFTGFQDFTMGEEKMFPCPFLLPVPLVSGSLAPSPFPLPLPLGLSFLLCTCLWWLRSVHPVAFLPVCPFHTLGIRQVPALAKAYISISTTAVSNVASWWHMTQFFSLSIKMDM